MYKRLSALMGLLLLAGCGGSGSDGGASFRGSTSASSTRFVAFGDAGKGSEKQIAVGDAMAEVCAARGCDFALELGDNFYDAGVQSVNDEQFQTKFEIPYANLKVPVYVTLGNHDNSIAYGEGADNARGDYQVDYHYLAGRTSEKWRMPARYYRFTSGQAVRGGRPLAEFFSLDSNPLTAIVSDPTPQWGAVLYGSEQLSWFEGELKNSTAHWKVAFAHHPYLSNGLHGNAGNFDGVPPEIPTTTSGKPWKDLLDATVCRYGVDLYIAGHDHDLEWLKPVETCGKTHFIVSGAAEGPRPFRPTPVGNDTFWQLDDTLGFFWIELRGDSMTISAFTLDAAMQLPKDAQGRPVPTFEQTAPKPN